MGTGRWPGLSAEHYVSYTGNESLMVITMSRMSRTSGITEGLCGLFDGQSGQKFKKELSSV